ncbi:MAG: hypothetical protein HYU97_02285 [Deltaproteobacteria bacterium]|nr:hypothetical protein [Deltaproteobacteria bacterium]
MRMLPLNLLVLFYLSIGVAQAESFDTHITLDLAASGKKVERPIIGGNVLYNYSSVLFRDAASFSQWGGGSVRYHMYDDTRWGQRWDTQTIEPTGVTKNYNLENLEEWSGAWVKELQGQGKMEIDYWQSAGAAWNRHSLKLEVANAADRSSLLMPKLDQDNGTLAFQFAFKIDAATLEGSWLLLHTDDSRIQLWVDDTLTLRLTSKVDPNLNIVAPTPLTLGKWYLITVNLSQGNLEFWLGSQLLAAQSTSLSTGKWANWHLGYIPQSNAKAATLAYRLDEVRVHSQKLGTRIQPPWNNATNQGRFDKYYSFDGNHATIDDFLKFAQMAKLTPVIQIPLTPGLEYGTPALPGTTFGWDTPQYWADLLEYMNGTADADYKNKQFDFTHNTPTDNWANLRAQRGHFRPWNVKYIEVGNEPYYTGWNQNNNWAGYAQKWAHQALLLKEVDPNIQLGLPGRRGWGTQDIWSVAIPIIQAESPIPYIDFLAVHHYTKIYNVGGMSYSEADQLHWYLGAPAGWRTLNRPDAEAGRPVLREVELAQQAIDQYFAEDEVKPFVALTEYGFEWKQYSYYDSTKSQWVYVGNTFADAFQRISALGEMARLGAKLGHTFVLDSDQKFVYGVIGDNDASVVGRLLTPSYWAFTYFARGLSNQALYLTPDIKTRYLTWDMGNNVKVEHATPDELLSGINKWGETYTNPLVSIWPFLNPNNLFIVMVNYDPVRSSFVSMELLNASSIDRSTGVRITNPQNDPFSGDIVVNGFNPSALAQGGQLELPPLSISFVRFVMGQK